MEDNILTLSTGVKLELFKPSLLAIREVERQVNANKPKPPEIYLEDKERSEENPDDPDYINELNAWQADGTERQFSIALVTGSKINYVPNDIPGLDSEEWHGILSVVNVPLGKSTQERYIQWTKYVAAPTAMDFGSILIRLLSLVGVREEEVAEAVESFRSYKEGTADNVAAINGDNTNGNKLRATTRRRSPVVRGVGGNG